ncbi:uncharacterized protein LOC130718190 [Lotus japonicus]|uniref:uncharacterized protein LOC130718190 n=1 Tax=Lotus japonicus TaxID=34305 RepID=UPI0025901C15|nr:uncharacterized protein LOC130718190 [Lotus japonicus]
MVINVAKRELDSLLEQEEVWWKQRSRASWLKHGGRNTRFFHQRRKRNLIEFLKDDRGREVEEDPHIARVLGDYFAGLFTSSNPEGVEETTDLVAERVSQSHLTVLGEPFTREEVEEALFQMHPTKALGLDGFPALFYQKHWDIIGDEILISTSRLKIILPDIIGQTQSAFVPGRLITDNALVAYECFHFMKKRIYGRNGMMAMKLDMSKAYDRVEWPFLQGVLQKMGFPPSWASALIEKSVASRMLHGIKVANRAPVISHLLFADDSIIFARANSQEAECVLDVLSTYEKASGQVINLDKSMLSVSRNVPQNGLDELKQLLNVKAVESFDKYLGLPTMIDIESMVSRFYWGGDVEQRGLHWASWQKLKRSKFDGGLCFRDFKSFNIALVAKNWWRIFSHSETLLAQVFKGVYFPHEDLLSAKLGYRPSYAWSSIMRSSWIFHEGGLWRIGDGSRVDILNDKWLPNGALVICRQDLMVELGVSKVTHLIDHATNSWKHDLVDFIFHPTTVSIILKNPLPLHGHIDTLMWPETVDGNYCFKSGYVFVRRKLLGACFSTSSQPSLPAPLWKKFWRTDAQPHCKEVAWCVVSGLVPVRASLRRRCLDVDPLCPLWASDEETGGEVPVPVVVVVQRCCMLAATPVVDVAVGSRPSSTLPSSWVRPMHEVYKLNFDASVASTGLVGFGLIVRDRHGEVLASAAQHLLHVSSPLLGEAMTFRRSMQLAVQMGFIRVLFEIDCLQLFQRWKKPPDGRSYSSSIISDCCWLSRYFDYVDLFFVRPG